MDILLIKCTHTGRSISTGLEVDPAPREITWGKERSDR